MYPRYTGLDLYAAYDPAFFAGDRPSADSKTVYPAAADRPAVTREVLSEEVRECGLLLSADAIPAFLKEHYGLTDEDILLEEGVIGLNIATRPDCISDEVLDYLTDLNNRTNLVIELGLQTIHDKTAKLINRCSTLKEFEDCLKKLNERNIDVVVHIINGLPYETKEDMIETAKYLSNKKILGIKIHMLHILKNTKLYELYKKEKFHVLTKEEYVDIVCDQLEYLNKNIVINRITGDPDINNLIEPHWLTKKFCVLNEIDKELVRRDSYQGKKLAN